MRQLQEREGNLQKGGHRHSKVTRRPLKQLRVTIDRSQDNRKHMILKTITEKEYSAYQELLLTIKIKGSSRQLEPPHKSSQKT